MHKTILAFSLLIFSASISSFADDVQQIITLKDGSQIKGQLAGVSDGVYTVKTPIIGDVHVAASDVANISNANASAGIPAANIPIPSASTPSINTNSNVDQQIVNTQQKIMSNPQSMAIIQQMAQNPEVMEALQDPALVQAVQNHDLQAVKDNPAIQKLISDPQTKALLEKLAAQQQQGSS